MEKNILIMNPKNMKIAQILQKLNPIFQKKILNF